MDYTADQAEAVALAREGRCQAAFLIAPTTPEELQAVVRGGELLAAEVDPLLSEAAGRSAVL